MFLFRIAFRFLGICAVVFLAACGGDSGDDPSPPGDIPEPERVTISGAGELGIFDPSVTYDPGTGRLWMSYSSVDTSTYYDPSLYWAVSIRLAYSDDNGASWTDSGVAVAPYVETVVGPMTESHPDADIPVNSQGIWQSETSSLIYDPGAPVAERWKLIWHQYLNANLTSFFVDYSWIAMKMAASPIELSAATTIKLFGGAGLQAENSITGAPVYSPVAGVPAIQLNSDITQSSDGADLTELNLCIFAEPGLHATTNALYLAVYCADASTVTTLGKVTEYIVYFRCLSPCNITNAMSWEYMGRLLTPADALAATGDHFFQAPAVVEKNGTTFLLVTPVNVTSVNSTTEERYNGCRVYEFNDIDSNQLLRINGDLVEAARVDGIVDTHNGACGAYNGLDGGILLSQFGSKGTADAFQIYKSQVGLP